MENNRTGLRESTPSKALMEATYNTALQAGIPVISLDNAARILAVLYVHGNNEFMVHSDKFHVEINYLQKRFKIDGGEVPDKSIIPKLRQYIEELEMFEQTHPELRYPEWADKLFRERYGFKLIN